MGSESRSEHSSPSVALSKLDSAKPRSKEDELRRGERRTFRRRATPEQWIAFRESKLYRNPCRVCGCWKRRTLHHIVPRSMGGDDVADNLVALCGHGTTGCHGHLEARDRTALRQLAENLTDAEYAYGVGKLGEGAMGRLFGV